MKVGSRPVEWKPSPDMYRMDTQEGMEAYEASFRMKIRTSGDLVIARSGDRETSTAESGSATRASLNPTPIWNDLR